MLGYFSLDGWMVGYLVGPAMYVFQTNQIAASMNNQCNCLLQSRYLLMSKTCFGKIAEKAVSFCVVSPRLMITGIETTMQYIFLRKGVLKMDFYRENTNRNYLSSETPPWSETSQRFLYGELFF